MSPSFILEGNIVLDNVTLDNIDNEKLLRVIVDKYLTWKHHLDKTAKTISKNIALLRRIKRYLPPQPRLAFYKTHIQPHLDYCNTIWGLSTHVPRTKDGSQNNYECTKIDPLCPPI